MKVQIPGVVLIFTFLIGLAFGFYSSHQYHLAAPDTTVQDIDVEPMPVYITDQAAIDSLVADSVAEMREKLIERLPEYNDTLFTTIFDTVDVSQPIRYAQSDVDTLGYTDTQGDFIPQGAIQTTYLYPPYNRFIYDYNAFGQQRTVITRNTYLFGNKYADWLTKVGLGVVAWEFIR